MYVMRLFATRHARVFERLYRLLEGVFVRLDPVLSLIGYNRLEGPVSLVERLAKGFLFDCQMCGQCVLSSTGMSCPMNCPKSLRNGPCGGVRDGGMCEVNPAMRCVWVEGWHGAGLMRDGLARIKVVQPPVNRELEGSSSWLRVVREKAMARKKARRSSDPSKQRLASIFARARRSEPASAPLEREPDAALSEQAVSESTSVYKPAGYSK